MFFLKLTSQLSKYTRINNYAIKQINSQQLLYGPIYSLESVKSETSKAYIKTNLANICIRLFKSPIGASIFFN